MGNTTIYGAKKFAAFCAAIDDSGLSSASELAGWRPVFEHLIASYPDCTEDLRRMPIDDICRSFGASTPKVSLMQGHAACLEAFLKRSEEFLLCQSLPKRYGPLLALESSLDNSGNEQQTLNVEKYKTPRNLRHSALAQSDQEKVKIPAGNASVSAASDVSASPPKLAEHHGTLGFVVLIRPDWPVYVSGIPVDLTKEEALRAGRIVEAYGNG